MEIENPKHNVKKEYIEYLSEIQKAAKDYLKRRPPHKMIGYHLNQNRLDYLEEVLHAIGDIRVVNNVGDPYLPNGYFQQHTLQQEQKLVLELLSNWGGSKQNSWGYITTGGTEGNEAGLTAGIQKLAHGNPIVLFSDQAHYSVEKICKNANCPYLVVPSQDNGEFNYNLLGEILSSIKGTVVLLATLGTTMKGASDQLEVLHLKLQQASITRNDYYIHLDAALAGGYWVHDNKAPRYKIGQDFDSISISGHKWYGGFVAGFFGIHNESMGHGRHIEYITSIDRAISGSRNGMIPPLWLARLYQLDWQQEYQRCQKLVEYALEKFQAIGVDAKVNPHSLMIYFPKPKVEVCEMFQLPVDKEIKTKKFYSHIIILPHVTRETLEEFICAENWE
ncbi:MAG: hypothetical protein KDD40_03255 [Bdellovibrionales bacterium]|nr:hypothetical protein [Bdellovibrionales bacterium]